jgi:hypothetical protein
MRARWCNAAIVALGMAAASCSGGGGGARSAAAPSTTDVATTAPGSPAGGAPAADTSTTAAPGPSTTAVATTEPPTTATTVADTVPPVTVPFVDAPPTTSALAESRAEVGVAYPFILITRCGIAGTSFDQREWRNDPPLADPGTRPEGWNPSYEQGTMTLVSPDVAEFASADGMRKARFVPRPSGSADLPPCD